jgi:hypothetical protein
MEERSGLGRPHDAVKPRCTSAEWGDKLPWGFGSLFRRAARVERGVRPSRHLNGNIIEPEKEKTKQESQEETAQAETAATE